MYSLLEHIVVGVFMLWLAHRLLDIFGVHSFSRQFIEIIVWAAVILFIASGLWMPLV